MKAFFSDGHTSAMRESEVKLLPGTISISYLDADGIEQVSNWNVAEIHKLDVRTSSTVLRYGEFPQQVLQLAEQHDLDEIIERYPYATFHQSSYNRFVSLGWKGMLFSLLGVLIFGVIFFVFGAPALSDAFANAIPEEYETYIGKNVQETYLQYLEVDSVRSQTLQLFYNELDYASNYEIQVVIVESDLVNAFALPGGFIVVYSGILDIIEDEQELAALLAHEASHINGRHSLRMMARSLSFYLLLSIISGDFGGFSSVMVENSTVIGNLSYSRSIEKEADLEGIKLMQEAALDPEGMIHLFKKFTELRNDKDRDSEEGFEVDTSETRDSASTWGNYTWRKAEQLLSTHQFPENRIEYLLSALEDKSTIDSTKSDKVMDLYDKLQMKENND